MKLITHTFLFSLLFLAISCGGYKSSQTTLVVSQSMMLSNANFDGGLMIQGQGPEGQSFSTFIPRNGSEGNQMKILLNKGSWNFKAIGWGGPDQFSGTTRCAELSTNLSDPSETVTLSVNEDSCRNQFGEAKNLTIVTCSQFHKHDGTKVSSPADASFCDEDSPLLVSEKKWAKSVKVSFLKKDLDSSWTEDAGASRCFDTTEGSISIPTTYLFPKKHLPLRISLYDTLDCAGPLKGPRYDFYKGLDHNYLLESNPQWRHESLLTSDTPVVNVLFLSTSDIKRGTSSFLNCIPEITCNSGSCAPKIASGTSIYGPGYARYTVATNVADSLDCSTPGFVVTSSGLTSVQCRKEENDEQSSLVYDLSFPSSCGSSITCTFTYTLPGLEQTISVIYSNSFLTPILSKLYASFGHALKQPGHLNLNDTNRLIFPLYEKDKARGRLSMVAQMFQPDGPAGVLGEGLTCNRDLDVTKMISFFDEGWPRTYQVELKGKNKTTVDLKIPAYITSSPPTEYYDALMTVRRLDGVVWITETQMKFSCFEEKGELQHQFRDMDHDKTYEGKDFIFWNTSYHPTRFEFYSSQKVLSPEGLESAHVEFERSFNLGISGQPKIRSISGSFHTHKDGSEFNQRAERFEIASNEEGSDTKLGAHTQHIELKDLDPYALFNKNVYFNEQKRLTLDENKALAFSPDKSKKIQAYIKDSKVYLMGQTNREIEGEHLTQLNLDVNNNGKGVACWKESDNLKAYLYNGSTWSLLSTPQTSVAQINCKINSSGNIFLTYTSSGKVEVLGYIPSYSATVVSVASGISSLDSNYLDTKILDDHSLGVVYKKDEEVFFSDVSSSFSLNSNIEIIDIGSQELTSLEIVGTSSAAPEVNLYTLDGTTPYFTPYTEENGTFIAGTPIPSIKTDQKRNCFNFATTTGVPLDAPNSLTSCPDDLEETPDSAINSSFYFNIESLNPEVIEEIFTPSEDFRSK